MVNKQTNDKRPDLVWCIPLSDLLCPNCGENIGKRSSYNRGYASTEARHCKCGKVIWIGGDGTLGIDGGIYNQLDYLEIR